MQRAIRAVFLLAVLALSLTALRLAAQEGRGAAEGRGGRGGAGGAPAARQEPQRSTRMTWPGLLWHEDWKSDPNAPNVNNADEPEHPVGQGDVASPNLQVHVYGHAAGTRIANQTYNNNLTYAMTLLCESNCAITLSDKNNYMDLSGAATLRWRTRVSGFHNLRPIIKLADGRWLVGDKNVAGPQTSWAVTEFQLVDIRWRNLVIDTVVENGDGYWVDYPDLTKVDEIGFTDLMRGSGHGSGGGSRIDWLEVYGGSSPRSAGAGAATAAPAGGGRGAGRGGAGRGAQ